MLREKADKKIEDAAQALECSTAKISRLETGKGVPKLRDVRDLMVLYGVADDEGLNERLLGWATDGQGTGWWNDFRDLDRDQPEYPGRYVELENDASIIQSYEGDFVPGLLQTADYADAIIGMFAPDASAKDRRRMVELRTRRQAVLRRADAPLRFDVLLGEPVLLRPCRRPGVMAAQFEAILKAIDELPDTLDVRVIPLAAGLYPGVGAPFSVIRFADPTDPDVVFLEGPEGGTYLEKQDHADRYGRLFDGMAARALDREASTDRLKLAVMDPVHR